MSDKVYLDKITVSAVGMMVTNLGNEVRNLKAQLKEAEKVIDFYADKNNWLSVQVGYGDKIIIKNDLSDHENDDQGDNLGGERAREYKTKYNKDKG